MRDAFPEAVRRAQLKPVRVLGIGSPFGQDRIGWEVVTELEDAHGAAWPQEQVALECLDRPGAGLVDWLRAPGLVILIDAMRSGAAPGTVREFRSEDLLNEDRDEPPLVSSHDFGMLSALRLADALGDLAARVRVLGVEMAADPSPHSAEGREPGRKPARKHANTIVYINELIKNFLSGYDASQRA